ncbi:MAG: hypothetical protein E6G97_25965 [Alphaproteobacteria bacterium]|nr:MAG: hypothetical protein E6G97_25965 [Alphaproteobacteria bacterium]
MAGTTTAMCTQFKQDILQGKHCFNATITKTGDTHTNQVIDNLSNITGLAVGMGMSGTGIAANTVIARFLSSTSIEPSKATTATNAGVTFTFNGDAFKAALIKVGPTGTYGAASVNYSDITGNSDEVSGTGYTAGGIALTNVTPTTSGTTAFTDFQDVSWTSASFSTTATMLYNTSQRGETANRAVSTHDFGGTQTVTAGTFTLVFPTPDASNAILRIA